MDWRYPLDSTYAFKTLTVFKMCTYKVLCNKVDIKNKVKFLKEKMIGKIIYIHMSRTVI